MVEMAGGVGEMTGRDDDDGGGRTVVGVLGVATRKRHLDLRRKFNTPSSRLAAQVPLQSDLVVFVSNGR